MTSWIPWDIDDATGNNPIKIPAEFEFNLEFEYDPGELFDNYTPDGDGYPGCPPSVKVIKATCKTIKPVGAPLRVPTAYELDMLEDWFMSQINENNNLGQQIQEYGLEQMCVEPYCDDVDD